MASRKVTRFALETLKNRASLFANNIKLDRLDIEENEIIRRALIGICRSCKNLEVESAHGELKMRYRSRDPVTLYSSTPMGEQAKCDKYTR